MDKPDFGILTKAIKEYVAEKNKPEFTEDGLRIITCPDCFLKQSVDHLGKPLKGRFSGGYEFIICPRCWREIYL